MKKISIIFGILCSLSFICANSSMAVGNNATTLDNHDSIDFAARPNNVVIVAKGFGVYSSFAPGYRQYTSIGSAFDNISPSANNPYIVKVMPGTYSEDVVMKSNVHLEGSGPEVTTIDVPTDGPGVDVNGITSGRISGFTIKGDIVGNDPTGIWDRNGSSVVIENNIFSNLRWPLYFEGSSTSVVQNNTINAKTSIATNVEIYGSSPAILNNVIKGTAGDSGIYLEDSSSDIYNNKIISANYNCEVGIDINESSSSSSPTIHGNYISSWGCNGISINDSSSPNIMDNIVENNDGHGIYHSSTGPVTIKNNQILDSGNSNNGLHATGSGLATVTGNTMSGNPGYDIRCNNCNVSFNVYSSSYGTINGNYNVDYQGNAH